MIYFPVSQEYLLQTALCSVTDGKVSTTQAWRGGITELYRTEPFAVWSVKGGSVWSSIGHTEYCPAELILVEYRPHWFPISQNWGTKAVMHKTIAPGPLWRQQRVIMKAEMEEMQRTWAECQYDLALLKDAATDSTLLPLHWGETSRDYLNYLGSDAFAVERVHRNSDMQTEIIQIRHLDSLTIMYLTENEMRIMPKWDAEAQDWWKT